MYVQAEDVSFMLDGAHPHRAVFGEWVAGILMLKTEISQRVPGGLELTFTARDHEVSHPFARAPRDDRTADVLDRKAKRLSLDHRGDPLRHLGRSWIVWSADGWSILVFAY